MARLTLLSVAMVAVLVFTNSQAQQQPDRNVMNTLEHYYRARLRQDTGNGNSGSRTSSTTRTERTETGGRQGGREWDWEWNGASTGRDGGSRESSSRYTSTDGERRTSGSGSSRSSGSGTNNLGRLSNVVQDLQMRMFMDEVKETSLSYQNMCPKLMDMLERGFLRTWLTDYMTRRSSGSRGGQDSRTDRGSNWSNEFNRYLRRRPTETRERETRESFSREGRQGSEWDTRQGGDRETRQGSEWDTRQGGDRETRQGSEWDTRQGGEWEGRQGSERETRQGSEWDTRQGGEWEGRQGSERETRQGSEWDTRQGGEWEGRQGGEWEGRQGSERSWEGEEFATEARRQTATTVANRSMNRPDPNSPMWRGLMASCYIYQDLVFGNAPRLDSTRGRAAQTAQAAQAAQQ